MALLTNEEKAFLQEAINIYLQIIQKRVPQEQLERLVEFAENTLQKLEQADAGSGNKDSGKPRGISDEWFQNCCIPCDKLLPGGRCADKITEKFPGKCDPILLYERAKNVKG